MTNNEKIKTAIAVGVTAFAVVDSVRIIRRERKNRAQMKAAMQTRLDAVPTATQKIIERIDNGEYDHDYGFTKLLNDFEFEIIAASFDK